MAVASSVELTDLIYGSLFGECSWQDFLDRLATTLPNGKSAFHYQDIGSPVAHVGYVSGFSSHELDQFHRHFAAINPWVPRTLSVPVGCGLTGESIVPRAELTKTEFYNDWLKSQTGCETSIGVTIVRDDTRTFILSTCTSSIDSDFNHEAAGLYTELAPHLRRAVDFARRGDLMSGEWHAGHALFETIGAGLIYVSETGRIRSLNDRAQRMISDGEAATVTTGGKLALKSERAAETLRFLLSRQGVQLKPYVAVEKSVTGANYKLTLLRMKSDPFTELLNGPTVAVIIEPGAAAHQRSEQIQARYRLTPKEAEISAAIAAGLSLKEIALGGGLSYETVRSHVKNIFKKLEVSSQAALVARLLE